MATTYRLRRKTFANVNPNAVKGAANVLTKSQAVSQGFNKSAFSWGGIGNMGSALSGTKTMINKDLLAKGNAAMANATTDAQKQAAQKMIDSARTTVTLTGSQRAGEAAKGLGKMGLTAGAVGTVAAGKKVDNAANGIG